MSCIPCHLNCISCHVQRAPSESGSMDLAALKADHEKEMGELQTRCQGQVSTPADLCSLLQTSPHTVMLTALINKARAAKLLL